jgi:hypothetical protein
MMFFGLMGLAALVIDMGFVRLAQRQMQTAVDSAALEGLRWRDSTTDPHQQASNMAAYTFDADLDLTTSDTQYGAGPVVTFSGGVGPPELAASQLMQPGTSPVYKPRRSDGTPGLELNENSDNPNAIEGDMRVGQYGLNDGSGVESAYPKQATVDEGGDATYATDNPYSRRDFFQQKPGPTPNAFLVRMRRTANPNGIDSESGISSGGPTLPILFGRGSLMARSGNGMSVSSGITVRSTAIAAVGDGIAFGGTSYSAGRTKTAGRSYAIPGSGSQPAVTIPGVAPFALESSFWASLSSGSPSGTLTFVPEGNAQSSSDPPRVEIQRTVAGGAIQTIGLLLTTTADNTGHLAASATSIGQPPQLLATGFDDSALLQDSAGGGVMEYVPIYTTVSLGGQSWTIIGFGCLSAGQWSYTPASQQTGGAAQFTISLPSATQPPYQVASQNASGVIGLALPATFTTNQQDVNTLFQLHAGEATDPSLAPDNMTNSVYAPVLANHYIGPTLSSP